MTLDVAAIEARLRERAVRLKSGALSETELRALAEESTEILRQLREIRAGILPALGQAEALLRQLEADAVRPSPQFDFRG